MSTALKKFDQLHNKAKQLRKHGKLPQARQCYSLLLKTIDIKDVDYIDYIVVMSQLGDIERALNSITESKKIYIQGLNLLGRAPSNVSRYELQKQKYHLLSNLGLIQCSQAQKIPNKIVNYKKFRSFIDQTLKYYKVCEQIVVKMIIENKDITQQNEDQNKIDWWKIQFITLIVNLCTALSEEAFQFQDKNVMSLMISLIQKAQSFYEQCRKRTKQLLKNLLSKSFYFKAICLKFLNKKKESEEYFLKDYKYCKQNNLKDDLRKTIQQIFKFYLQNFKFEEARKYYKTSEHTAYVNEEQKKYKDLMRRTHLMKKRLKQFQRIDTDDLQGLLYELHEMKCSEEALQFNNCMRQANQFKSNPDFRYWVEYYAAQYHVSLGNYSDALKHLKQATKIKDNQPTEKAWCSLLNAIILDKLQKDRNKVRQAYQKCLNDSKNQQDQGCKIDCQKQYKNFLFNQQRMKTKITYDLSLFDKLLQFMRDQKNKRIQMKKNRMEIEEEIQQSIVEQFPQSMQDEIQKPKKKLIKPLNQVEAYIQNCQILNQEPLQVFKQLLKNPNNIDLQKLIYFNTQQLLALINSTSKISNLDLTNFVMTTEYLKRIKASQNSNNFTSIKINMINASIFKNNQKIQFYAELQGLLRSNPTLEYLLISNAYESEQLQKIIHTTNIKCLESLTVLKLKQCQIQDKDLIFMSLGEYLPQLKKLSLSHNRLKGKTLQVLTSLKSLQSLSLSSNPLDELKLDKKFQNLKKISLNNLQNKIPPSFHEIFIYLLISCETIKMKNCQQVCQQILIKLVENAMSLQTPLYSLKQLNLFGSQLKGKTIVQTLQRYRLRAPNLSYIDLRNCRIIFTQNNQQIQNQLQQFQNAFNYHKNQFYEGVQNTQNKNRKAFKMNNLKFINQSNAKKFKNFSIY